jgi:uncharacterized protein
MSTTHPSLRTPRTTLHRRPQRGDHTRATIDAILDEGLVCHLGFTTDGQPYVLPTTYARVGDVVYVHGSAASRMLRELGGGVPACLTVTLLDGLVLARSAFHHSMNYRCVVLLGSLRPVDDAGERAAALDAIVDHVVPGRVADLRPTAAKEFKATTVLKLPIIEASAKVRRGYPLDDADDLTQPCWAGTLPLALTPSAPQPALDLSAAIAVPPYLRAWRRGV